MQRIVITDPRRVELISETPYQMAHEFAAKVSKENMPSTQKDVENMLVRFFEELSLKMFFTDPKDLRAVRDLICRQYADATLFKSDNGINYTEGGMHALRRVFGSEAASESIFSYIEVP